MTRMWAGYAFSRDFREDRGHAYMLDDQTYTERQQAAKQPGTCLHCHASLYVAYRKVQPAMEPILKIWHNCEYLRGLKTPLPPARQDYRPDQ